MNIRRLTSQDSATLAGLNRLFSEAFEDPDQHQSQKPEPTYLSAWLSRQNHIALAAFEGETLIGGLIAYVLDKVEQARSEICIYDLAVAERQRRHGVATALVEALKPMAREAGAWVIYVQADYVDPPAIALYEKLGVREEVLHFDIPVNSDDQ